MANPPKIKLPSKPRIVDVKIGSIVFTVFGSPKIGKTTLAGGFPDVMFLATEDGQKFIKAKYLKIDKWETFQGAVVAIEKNPKCAKTICIDCVDLLSNMVMNFIAEKNDVDYPNIAALEFGRGWHLVEMEFAKWLTRLCNAGPGVIFICHEKEREITIDGEDMTKVSLNLPKRTYDVITRLSDWTFHYQHRSKKTKVKGRTKYEMTRGIQGQSSGDIDAGSRMPAMVQFPAFIEMPADGKEAYEALRDEFKKVLKKMSKEMEE